MITRIIAVICALFLPLAGRAQINLVLNPSFEEYSHCPDEIDEAKYCSHWMSLDSSWSPPDWAHCPWGVPQYCNVCSTSPYVGLPTNSYFHRSPRTGNGIMYSVMFSNEYTVDSNSREYLQGHLSDTLIFGHTYNVAFFVSLAQSSVFAVNNVGAYLDNGFIDSTHTPGLPQITHIPQIADTQIILDTVNWVKVNGVFVASGSERLITIGNFSDKIHTHVMAVADTTGSTGILNSIYLIDDVSVIDCSNVPFAGNDTLIHPGDSAWLGPHEQLLPYTWYVLGSGTPVDSGGGFWVHPAATTTYVLEQRLCETTKYDTVTVNVWPLGVANSTIRRFDNLAMYPNPSAGLLTIEHAEGCEVVFYDVVGREVRRMRAVSDREEVDISALQRGVYFVRVLDASSGYTKVLKLVKE